MSAPVGIRERLAARLERGGWRLTDSVNGSQLNYAQSAQVLVDLGIMDNDGMVELLRAANEAINDAMSWRSENMPITVRERIDEAQRAILGVLARGVSLDTERAGEHHRAGDPSELRFPCGCDIAETGWLIERTNPTRWWTGVSTGIGADLDDGHYHLNGWTTDANCAVRFARREDAETVLSGFQKWALDARAVEHAWLAGRSEVLSHREPGERAGEREDADRRARHLCNYEGFGTLGDVCPACEQEARAGK